MNRHTLLAIGRSLKGVYNLTSEKPVPPLFLDLLKQLDAKQTAAPPAAVHASERG